MSALKRILVDTKRSIVSEDRENTNNNDIFWEVSILISQKAALYASFV